MWRIGVPLDTTMKICWGLKVWYIGSCSYVRIIKMKVILIETRNKQGFKVMRACLICIVMLLWRISGWWVRRSNYQRRGDLLSGFCWWCGAAFRHLALLKMKEISQRFGVSQEMTKRVNKLIRTFECDLILQSTKMC